MQLTIGLIAYYFIHSLLASDLIKASLNRKVRNSHYRTAYSLMSLVLLVPVGHLYIDMDPHIYLRTGVAGRLVFLTAALLSFRLFTLSFHKVNLTEFLGLKSSQNARLITSGIYQYIRHPLYLAVLIVLFGLFIAVPSDRNLIVLVTTTVYILIGSRLGESRLIREFGDQYTVYKAKTPMLFPRKYKVFFKYVLG